MFNHIYGCTVTSAEQEAAERKRKEPKARHTLAGGTEKSRQQLEQLYEKHHRETFRKALVDILLYIILHVIVIISLHYISFKPSNTEILSVVL